MPIEELSGDVEIQHFINKHKNAILDVYLNDSKECQEFESHFKEIADSFHALAFGRVDFNRFSDTTLKFSVKSTPTVLIFKGGILVKTVAGVTPAVKLHQIIEHLF